MKTETTKVVFRKFRNGEVIALFPELVGDMNPAHCAAYMHVGQHSAAFAAAITSDAKLATKAEYAGLYRELEQIGYSLDVVKKMTYRMQSIRETLIKGQ